MGLKYEPGPILDRSLNEDNFHELKSIDEAVKGLEFQKEAVEKIRKRLPDEKSLIGFVGGPWTLFTYACEGKHAGHLIGAKRNFSLFQKFCEIMVPLLKKNIELQLEGGAEVVMVFDTAAGEVSPAVYTEILAPQLDRLAQDFKGKLGYYAKGTTPAHYQHPTFNSGAWAGFGFDHRYEISERMSFGSGFVQGNFDQALLFLEPEDFEKRLMQYLEPIQKLSPEERAGWVCGLGHGVLPKTPEENVRNFVKIIRNVFGE